MGTVTKVQIANLALSQIGARNITTFGETTTEEGRRINATYSFVLDEVLSEYSWTFSQKRHALVNMTTPATDYDAWVTSTSYAVGDGAKSGATNYACLVPHTSGVFATDLTALKWVATEAITDIDDDLNVIYYLPTDFLRLTKISYKYAKYQIEGNRLLSDTAELKIKYTYRNDDPTLYSGQFVTALSTRLAAEICFNITQSANKAQAILEKYETIDLKRAASADSQQGTPEELIQDEWESARLI